MIDPDTVTDDELHEMHKKVSGHGSRHSRKDTHRSLLDRASEEFALIITITKPSTI